MYCIDKFILGKFVSRGVIDFVDHFVTEQINEDYEMDKIRNNCYQSIIISLAAAVVSVAALVINIVFG